MNPAAIQNLLNESKLLHEYSINSDKYTIPAFMSSWITWEALRTRFIRVIIHHQGWLLKNADIVLAKKRISSMKVAEIVIADLGLKHPHQWPKKSAKSWKALAEIEPLRHRLIHGFKGIDPGRVKAATKVIIYLVENNDWLSIVPITDLSKEKNQVIVGSVLKYRRSSRKTHDRCLQELADIMNVDLKNNAKPLPSLDRLEDMLKTF